MPGLNAANPLDLYYTPHSHSLVAAFLWSAAAFVCCRLAWRQAYRKGSFVVTGAVFSHWVLDFIVHRPDLPLYDNSGKVGLGLWNAPLVAFGLEVALLFGGCTSTFAAPVGPGEHG